MDTKAEKAEKATKILKILEAQIRLFVLLKRWKWHAFVLNAKSHGVHYLALLCVSLVDLGLGPAMLWFIRWSVQVCDNVSYENEEFDRYLNEVRAKTQAMIDELKGGEHERS